MDHLDARVFDGLKESLRKAVKNIRDGHLYWGELPVILIDYKYWETSYFKNEYDAVEHLEKKHKDWDDSPPEGEDEELIIIKFVDQEKMERHPILYKNYKFFKEIQGVKYFRGKSFVEFEPELIINISI